MHLHTYRKDLNPYAKTADELKTLKHNAGVIGGDHFFQMVIPIKGQSWFSPGCRSIKKFIPYKDGAWALRVGYKGDDYEGHVGMAFCPFASGEDVAFVDKKNPTNVLRIRTKYVAAVQRDGLWYWRVEYLVL